MTVTPTGAATGTAGDHDTDAAPAAVRTYFDAVNAEDWATFATVWPDNPELVAVGSPPRRGRDAVLAYYPRLLTGWTEHLDEIRRVTVSADRAVVEIHFTGRHQTGGPVEFDAVDVFELADGRIRRLSIWYDVAALRAKLVPSPGEPTQPPALAEYFRCVNAEDWAGLAALWHPDAEASFVGARPLSGRDDIVAFYQRLFLLWTTHVDEPTRVLLSGTTATVEVHFTGDTADGRRIEFDAVDVIDLDGGLFRRLTNWYDILAVRRMLAAGQS